MVVIDFVMAYSSLLREKKRCDFVTLRSRHGDVISRIFTFLGEYQKSKFSFYYIPFIGYMQCLTH